MLDKICEGVATCVEHQIKHTGIEHDSYIKDTPDFLRIINKINSGPEIELDTLLATFDVIGLFTNIIHEEGLTALEDKLNGRQNPEVPTEYIVKMMELLLNNNIFEFDEFLWKQNVGAAMGCKPVPPYANVFMATIDTLIKNQQGAHAFRLLKRFLDDFFTMFKGSTKELHAMFVKMNSIHPTIKFTMNHTSIRDEPVDRKWRPQRLD